MKIICVLAIVALLIEVSYSAIIESNGLRYNGTNWSLEVTTTRPMLCGMNIKPEGQATFAELLYTDMTLPATFRQLYFSNWVSGNKYVISMTFFDPTTHEVINVSPFVATATPSTNVGLMELDATNAVESVITPSQSPLGPDSMDVTTTATSIELTFVDQEEQLYSLAYRKANATEYISNTRNGGTELVTTHKMLLIGLSPDTEYEINLLMLTKSGEVLAPQKSFLMSTIKTNVSDAVAPSEDCIGENMALLSKGASVSVSSNWAMGSLTSSFGGNNAIDGKSNTQWSSNGDGNNAWIEITLAKEETITHIGYWTRTMVNSALTTKFRLLNDGTSLGLFDTPDALKLYTFKLAAPVTTSKLRFEVEESTGGNTGAVAIEIYAECVTSTPPPSTAAPVATTSAPVSPSDTVPSPGIQMSIALVFMLVCIALFM